MYKNNTGTYALAGSLMQNKVNERDEFRKKERRKYCEKGMNCQRS
jgi:hypothetical protein